MKKIKSISPLPNLSAIANRGEVSGVDKRLVIVGLLGLFVLVQWLSLSRGTVNSSETIFVPVIYGAAFYFYYQRRQQLKFPRHPLAIGLICFGLPVLKLLTLYRVDVVGFWAVAPTVAIFGMVLLAAGFYGIKQFWRILFIVFFLNLFFSRIVLLVEKSQDLSMISAKFSSFILWYVGFESTTKGTLVYVNNGAIDIYPGCTAWPLIVSCMQLGIILYLFLPIKRRLSDLFIYGIWAFLITFPLSIIRLCIMALVVNDPVKFDYWHGPSGSNLFMTIGLVGFGALFLYRTSDDGLTSQVNSQPRLVPPQSSWLLNLISLVLALILLSVIFSPEGGAKRIADYELPEQVPLANWQFQSSSPFSLAEMSVFMPKKEGETITPEQLKDYQTTQVEANILMSGRHYVYETAQSPLNVQLSYVVSSDGTPPPIANNDVTENAYQNQLKTLQPNDPYFVYTGDRLTHLKSCLTPQGKAIVTHYAMVRVSRIRDMVLNPGHFYEWMIGKRLMWDRRCLWVNVAMDSSTPDAKGQLVSVWQDLANYWQHFPAF